MASFIAILLGISAKMGYLGIVLLMAIESSVIPLPSEVIIPPVAYLAHEGVYNIYLVIIAGVIGSVIGALANYFVALTLGRKIVYGLADSKIANLLFINSKKIEHSEKYFLNYGNISTFIGRLLPAVRHLISIPAGFSKMKLSKFILYTFLGSAVWVAILAIIGYWFGANKEKMTGIYEHTKIVLIICGLLAILAFIAVKLKKNKKNPEINPE